MPNNTLSSRYVTQNMEISQQLPQQRSTSTLHFKNAYFNKIKCKPVGIHFNQFFFSKSKPAIFAYHFNQNPEKKRERKKERESEKKKSEENPEVEKKK